MGKLDVFTKLLEREIEIARKMNDFQFANSVGKDEQLSPCVLYDYIIEQSEVVYNLITQKRYNSSRSILRVSLESWAGLKYMLMGDFAQRSMAYLTTMHKLEIESQKRHIAGERRFEEFLEGWKNTNWPGGVVEPPYFLEEYAKKRVSDLEEMLSLPIYVDSVNQFNVLAKKKGKEIFNIKWYNLYDGPTSVVSLFRKVGMHGFYEVYYRSFSGYTHASSILYNRLVKRPDGNILLSMELEEQNGTPESLMAIGYTILREVSLIILEKRVPEFQPQYDQWAQETIKILTGRE